MNSSHLMAGASRFAHFAGLTRSASRRAADDDQRDDGKNAADDNDGDGKDADDDKGDDKGARDKGARGTRSRRAADDNDDDGKDAAADDDDDGKDADDDKGDDKGARGKGARGTRSRRAADDDDDDGKDAAADDDDDDDKQEMTGRSSAANARRRERERCAAIFGHKAAASNVALAASLAFETTMTRHEAIAVMRGQADRAPEPTGRRSTREDRNADLSSAEEPGGRKPKAGTSWGRSFTKLGAAPRG